MEKARLLYQQLYPGRSDDDFKASSGWLHRFKKRHGIRQLSMQGESLSADVGASEEFRSFFHKFVEQHNFTQDQLFNCDETDASEKCAKNFKSPKDRVTLMATANDSGDFQLPLVFIHKSAKPRCFSGINMSALPVHYYSQKSCWMDSLTFKDWFHKHFVPTVTKYLELKSLSPQALLLLDNAPSYSSVCTFVSADGKIKCMCLPPNVTSLIQPMDQGVTENIKRRYKKHLLRKLLQGSSEHDFFL